MADITKHAFNICFIVGTVFGNDSFTDEFCRLDFILFTVNGIF